MPGAGVRVGLLRLAQLLAHHGALAGPGHPGSEPGVTTILLVVAEYTPHDRIATFSHRLVPSLSSIGSINSFNTAHGRQWLPVSP
ncbi:hypothetical protein GCM10009619_02660 [Williamsia maris]